VDIDLFHDGEALILGIHDDGCGFDVGAVRERASAGNSIGLLGMKERATLRHSKRNDARPEATSIDAPGQTVHSTIFL
jgi:signal transduction histidine kinase